MSLSLSYLPFIFLRLIACTQTFFQSLAIIYVAVKLIWKAYCSERIWRTCVSNSTVWYMCGWSTQFSSLQNNLWIMKCIICVYLLSNLSRIFVSCVRYCKINFDQMTLSIYNISCAANLDYMLFSFSNQEKDY